MHITNQTFLKDRVRDQAVKPKLQCIMSDPSFSMVTVQCEDSGIVWETSSSRCSTPWASEASTTSDVFSLEGSPMGSPPGKIIFIMDEDNLGHKRAHRTSKRVSSSLKLKDITMHKSDKPSEKKSKHVLEDVGDSATLSRVKSDVTTDQVPLVCFGSEKPQELKHLTEAKTETEEPVAHAPVAAKSKVKDNPLRKSSGGLVHAAIQKFNSTEEPLPTFSHRKTAKVPDVSKWEQNEHDKEFSPISPVSKSPEKPVRSKIAKPLPVLTSRTTDFVSNPLSKSLPSAPADEFPILDDKPHPPITSRYASNQPSSDIHSALTVTMPSREHKQLLPITTNIVSSQLSNDAPFTLINPTTNQESKIYLPIATNVISNQYLSNVPSAYSTETSEQDKHKPVMKNPGSNQSLHSLPSVPAMQLSTADLKPYLSQGTIQTPLKWLVDPEDPAKDPQDPEVLKNLFSIVSDGYEILNIVVPQVMCSVDQEESNQMQDKLEYLETNPLIQAKHCDEMQATECEDENNVCEESSAVKEKEEENEEQQEPVEETPMKHTESEQNDSLTEVENSSSVLTPTKNENNEMDYFEKYTLFDDKVPITLTIPKEIRLDEESVKTMKSPAEEREKRLSFSQSSDNILEEYDMLDNDLDEAFYGVAEENNTFDSHKTEKNPTSSVSDNKTGMEKDITDNPQLKASGTPLFDTEETVLIRSYLVPETIKMINPELLEEPPALAFLYKDLYEHATGEHKKDNEPSDEDSISSDVSFRSMSDTDDGTGVYFEKYILKDEVPSIAVKPKEEEGNMKGPTVWLRTPSNYIEEPFQEKTLESDLECEEGSYKPFEALRYEVEMESVDLKDVKFQVQSEAVPDEKKAQKGKTDKVKPIQAFHKVPSEERLHKDHGKHPSKAEPEKVLDISSSVHDKSALGMREELVTKQQDQLSVEAINKSEQVKDENIYLHQEEECAAQCERYDQGISQNICTSGTEYKEFLEEPTVQESKDLVYVVTLNETSPSINVVESKQYNEEEEFEKELVGSTSTQDYTDQFPVQAEKDSFNITKVLKTESLNHETCEYIVGEEALIVQQHLNIDPTEAEYVSNKDVLEPQEVYQMENVYVSTEGPERMVGETETGLETQDIECSAEIFIDHRAFAPEEAELDLLKPESLASTALYDSDSQPVQAEPKDDEEQCLDSDGDIAQALDYEIVTQEDLIQEELPSEYTADDIAVFEDRESLEHPGDGYEFVDELERDPVIEVEEQGFEIMEREELAEIEQKESKKPQLDTYCLVCRCPISAIDKLFGEHEDHEVTTLDAAVIEIKGKLNEKLLRLQERSTKIEELVTEIESIFNAVEEHCGKNEQLLEEQNEEMMKTTLTQYNEMSQSLEEVKKMKLEYLYEQMVSFQQGIDSAREILEKSIKDSEETDEVVFLTSCKATNNSLVSATEKTLSLEMMPSAFSLFEHYAESSVRSGQKMLKQVAVPRTPKLQAQEPNSATSTSVTVYWTVSEEDVIDCFQVYCMEEPQGGKEQSAMVEEYRVTVKESYCILEDLEPDKCYQVWVMAVNYTGCSLPSEKATFKTAPSAPGIKVMECTICWDTAVIRWSTVNPEAAESFTLEYCRQYSLEGEGLRSISGIKSAEQKVNLQPNENYFFYVRAVNTYGSSEQSEAALISTKGTRFHLKGEVDHPDLQVSSDGTVICFSEQQGAQITEIPVVYGELLPARGQHYWETIVDSCEAYRIGVCYPSTLRYSPLGENNTSWCMHCYPTGTRHSYEFLHNDVMASAMVTEYPARVGILLDYSAGRLSFFNAQSGQLLHNFRHRLTDAARPAFVVEKPGVMNLHTGIEIPDFVRHS
nr:PREDICTED: cardiomyopathy-associated protein 5 isoform X2 [Latimeria chalumnae]|eukprot:XP_014344878.1 PREDICTED: cardiomyopathy-associated protein 5 isoform X2 [Latimeria chalumnae]